MATPNNNTPKLVVNVLTGLAILLAIVIGARGVYLVIADYRGTGFTDAEIRIYKAEQPLLYQLVWRSAVQEHQQEQAVGWLRLIAVLLILILTLIGRHYFWMTTHVRIPDDRS